MALTTYGGLKTAIADWLARTDLTSYIPDFVKLAEARIARALRTTTTIGTMTLNAEKVALAATVAELRSIRLVSGSASQDTPLTIVTPEVLAELRAGGANVTGRPEYAAVVGSQLVLYPTPDASYTAEIIFFEALTALTTDGSTNTVLTNAPDVYLYLSLAAAEPFLKNDERLALWKSQGDEAMNELQIQRQRQEYGASVRRARLPQVFG